jgi:hypothetical protein
MNQHLELIAQIMKQNGFKAQVLAKYNCVEVGLARRKVYSYEVARVIDSEELPITNVKQGATNVYIRV